MPGYPICEALETGYQSRPRLGERLAYSNLLLSTNSGENRSPLIYSVLSATEITPWRIWKETYLIDVSLEWEGQHTLGSS
jgi:hypothetical protein